MQAQDNGGGQGGPGGGGRRRGQGGGGGFGQGGGGFGQGGQRMDPAQIQQMMMENYRDQLGFTNDTEWAAVEPLVQKVSDARTAAQTAGRGFGRGGRGGGGGGFAAFGGGQPNPERDALQKAIDDNAPSGQVKDALAKYKASVKDKHAKFQAAQAELKKVLSVKQEAQATLMGLLE